MRFYISLLLFLWTGLFLHAQSPYAFSEIKSLNATPVKSQDRTGTCWAFSTGSFLESELIRNKMGEHDLSEMFFVRYIYKDKCNNYVRRQGTANLSQGGLAHDVMHVAETYGVIPEAVYPGRQNPSVPFDHSALVKKLKEKCDAFVALGKKGELPADWISSIDTILDQEFGPVPEKFMYKGREYNPLTFRNYLGLVPNKYVNITSFNHHPFNRYFILEVPDNFSNGSFYNVELDDMMRIIQSALQAGYTVEWDADVSNKGFSRSKGIAIVPLKSWAEKSTAEQENTFVVAEEELFISQEYRQDLFDRQITQDDHLMHIIGMVDESNSGTFYKVKNSWGEQAGFDGYYYVSEAYLRLNTISITLHIDALPDDIKKKLDNAYTGFPKSSNFTVPAKTAPIAPQQGPFKTIEGERMEMDIPKKGVIKSDN